MKYFEKERSLSDPLKMKNQFVLIFLLVGRIFRGGGGGGGGVEWKLGMYTRLKEMLRRL